MTKFILHGGETGVDNEHNKAFYQEWVKDFEDNFTPTILLVYFSRLENELEYLEKSDKERFSKYTNNHSANFVVADPNLEVFEKQIKDADVVYVRGGSSEKLIKALLPAKDTFLNMVEGKTYAGSSAGVMAISHATRSNSSDWKEGLGLIPVNSIVHWSEDLNDSLENHRKENPDNEHEYLLIPETEFVIRNF